MRAAAALLLAVLLSAAPAVGQQSHLIVVSGLSGEPKYADAFYDWATTLIDAARERWGVPEANIVYLAEKTERDPGRISGRSTRENVERAVRDVAARAEADDQVFIVLIGHGSTRDGQSRFNLPGPDMRAADFADLLDAFPTQTIFFVNAASASGEFIPALSGENRAVITATKTRYERNETIFAAFFVEAYAGEGADVDKDQRVSALEAFNYARREVARAYEADGKLLTEHALLDDDGDGEGTSEPDPQSMSEGRLAMTLFLTGATASLLAAEAPSDPRLAALYGERRRLEQQVVELRRRKDEMDPGIYERQLEDLLVELALKTREIRALEEEEQ